MRSSESVLAALRTWDDSLVRSSGACRRPATGVLRSLQVSAGCCRPRDADFDRGCPQMACPEAAAAATAAPRPAVKDKIGSRIPGGSGQLCASPSGPISRVNRSPGQESCDPDPGTGRAPANLSLRHRRRCRARAPGVPVGGHPVCRSAVNRGFGHPSAGADPKTSRGWCAVRAAERTTTAGGRCIDWPAQGHGYSHPCEAGASSVGLRLGRCGNAHRGGRQLCCRRRRVVRGPAYPTPSGGFGTGGLRRSVGRIIRVVVLSDTCKSRWRPTSVAQTVRLAAQGTRAGSPHRPGRETLKFV